MTVFRTTAFLATAWVLADEFRKSGKSVSVLRMRHDSIGPIRAYRVVASVTDTECADACERMFAHGGAMEIFPRETYGAIDGAWR